MFRLIVIFLTVFLIGCASVPHSTDILVRYPVEGEIVWMSEDGSMTRRPYFVINHEDLLEFLKLEREVEEEKTSGSLERADEILDLLDDFLDAKE